MTEWAFFGLWLVWLGGGGMVLWLCGREFRRWRFNFNVLFSLLYLLTFYFGFPLTAVLAFRFGVETASPLNLLQAQLSATAFYAIYYVSYKTRLWPASPVSRSSPLTMTRLEVGLTSGLLALVALSTAAVFFANNGLLLFKLSSYSQIFSRDVIGVALKRFFYFFYSRHADVVFPAPDSTRLADFSVGDGDIWWADVPAGGGDPRQYHYCLRSVFVYRPATRLDYGVGADSRRR
ncbi:hypothetical protein OS42_44610 [Dickeya oryzae]